MTFKELKVRLINELSLMTIDDFGVYQNQCIEDYLQGVDKAENYVCGSGVTLSFKLLIKNKLSLQKDLELEKKNANTSMISLESKNSQIKKDLSKKIDEKKEIQRKDLTLHEDITVNDIRREQLLKWNSESLFSCESDIDILQNEYNDQKKLIRKALKTLALLESNLNIVNFELNELNLNHEKIDEEFCALEFIAKVLLRKELVFNGFDSFFLNDIEEPTYSNFLINYLKKTILEIPVDWRDQLQSIFSSMPCLSGYVRYYYRFNSENILVHKTVRKIANYNETDYSIFLSLINSLNASVSVESKNMCIYIALSGGILAKIKFAAITEKVHNFKTKEIELFCLESKEINVNFITQKQFQIWGLALDLPIGYYILTDKYIINITFSTNPILLSNCLSTAQIISLQNIIEQQKRKSMDNEDDD
jgi:hypothetical protein